MYIFQPEEEKSVRVKKEREHLLRIAKGMIGAPGQLTKRYNNKLFDCKIMNKEKK